MGKGKGSGGKNDFNKSGPKDLTHVDWKNPDHKRIVAACLVMGVYVLESDRQEKSFKDALAKPWFRSFKFQLFVELIDPRDKSIYGAIYRFESPSHLPPEAPEFVIAFRGTMLKKRSFYQDLKLDFSIILQYFHRTKRSKIAIAEVTRIVKDNPNVWLAGHSLGSALAVQAGKSAAKANDFLETFLFNPPFPRVKQWISKAKGKFTAILVTLFKGPHQLSEDDELTKTEWSLKTEWSPCSSISMT
ncbi:GDSL esterase/lipase [Cinnamomum micranthum f. kanehirae]|uniref:GDSL esterase/lipase n=1 Tax=Cinnamomum micranthum f. kanehirae TaxID=337451 RepID=A0A3S4PYL7_9MAGN|nr:GDSL esterase/lipase [Cinnamomum micranthum f. kanehirae]